MPAQTRAQIQAQIDQLSAELAGADTDDEIWIQEDGGPAIRVRGARATKVLSKYEHMWADEQAPEGEGQEHSDPAPEGEGLFKRRGK